ncbi:MAG TPA: LptA/OstA family protein [Terracidiphilus sp.]|nr:LptA/OstA family protein [Terracidiphilus sp.]
MRLTIERMRTLVIAAAVLLIAALSVFLASARFRNPFKVRDLPQKLGLNIQQEANGYTFSHALGAHAQYKIHASKELQLKDNRVILRGVEIELYSDDGKRVDRIAGDEFEYDATKKTATADGPVDITLMRPGPEQAEEVQQAAPRDKKLARNLGPATASHTGANDEIQVKTSGLTFDENTGVATTARRVDFSTAQASGSSMGATYDSQQGFLVLDRSVELTGKRNGEPVAVHAAHLEFIRDDNICRLQTATAEYRGGQASAPEAKVLFRPDGSAQHIDASGGFIATTATGGHLQAPTAAMDLDEKSQPRHGHLEGGVVMDSVRGARTVHGTSPTAEIEFTPKGELRHAHLERGVTMASVETGEQTVNGRHVPERVSRTWRSPVADIEFRDAGNGQVEPATIHGFGGVTIDGLRQRGDASPQPSKLAADEVSGEFGADSDLKSMIGMGHASMEQTSATGTLETVSGDRLDAQFAEGRERENQGTRERGNEGTGQGMGDVQTATFDGHVVLFEKPAPKPGAQPQPELRATAGHALYEGDGQWMYLTVNPRVVDGGMELTARKIDVTQATGDAYAHHDVKATWTNANDRGAGDSAQGSIALGGQDPAHVIADEARLHQATGVVEFDGNARLWQDANSVEGPVIVLDRDRRTLVARSAGAQDPVKVVLLSAGNANPGKTQAGASAQNSKPSQPAVIRVRGGDLWYSDADRRALMRGGALGVVTAETGTETSTSDQVELQLAPASGHASGQSQVERMTASGHVVVTSQGRRGFGEQLVYTGADGKYVLTGTAGAPPRMSDPQRGTATGEALIFNSRDDSVSIEGGGHETETQTTAPKLHLGTEPGNSKGTQRAAQPRGQQGSGSEQYK